MTEAHLFPRDVDRAVFEEIRLTLEEQGKAFGCLSPADVLDADLGLSSLDFVLLVSRLAARFGMDPFERSAAITDVRTAGDLCRLWRDLVGESGGDGLAARWRPATGTRTGSS
jgi:acyl carrier protein